jgi:hypothetical protein
MNRVYALIPEFQSAKCSFKLTVSDGIFYEPSQTEEMILWFACFEMQKVSTVVKAS